MNDYYGMGVMEAINAISAIIPDSKIHAPAGTAWRHGFSIAAAAMGRDQG